MRGLAVALGLALATASQPALAQASPDYRSADPRALIAAMKTAPRGERGAIADALVARRSQVLPVLWEAARFGDAQDKVIACSLIADMRDRDGVDAVVDASADPDVRVRRRAVTALRLLADRRAAVRLRELVRSESDLGVLKTSLVALARLGLPRDQRIVEPFLTHPDEGVRVVAAGSLAMLGDERGLDLVLHATTAADPAVQKSATYALGFFAGAAAGARLQAILADPDGAWKGYALVALAERKLATQSVGEQVATLDGLAGGRSRVLAEWSVERLTDIGGPDAAAALRKLRSKETPVGALAERRLRLLEVQP